jgi:hypothetical protein
MIQVGYLRSSNYGLVHSSPFREKRMVFYLSKGFDVELIYFNPNGVNLKDKTVRGWVLDGTEWKRVEREIPKVIDNMPRPPEDLTAELEKISTFTCHPFTHKGRNLSKISTYAYMCDNGNYQDIIIPSYALRPSNKHESIGIFEALEKYGTVILKPFRGSKGSGIHKIAKKSEDSFAVLVDKIETVYSKNDFLNFINSGNFLKIYMLQPYIPSLTKDNEPFDIRVLARRKSINPEFETFLFPRIGSPDGVVSNIHTGGYTMPIESFLQKQYGIDAIEIYDRLQELAETFPIFYGEYVDQRIFDLGLDIGIVKQDDGSYKFNLFEVNYWCDDLNCQLRMSIARLNYYKELYEERLEIESKSV